MSSVRLVVGGRRYDGWKAARVTRSLESLCGSFDLEVTDRWRDEEAWPIREEDPCTIDIDGDVVIDGFVGRRRGRISGDARDISFSGRDRAAAILDCSVLLDDWTFRKANLVDIAARLAAQFNLEVTVQAGLVVPKGPAQVDVSPGDGALDVLAKQAAAAGVLITSSGEGGILLTRTGVTRAWPLVLGDNILDLDFDYDAEERFHRYVVMTQKAGSDHHNGDDLQVGAEATDSEVRRTERVLVIRPAEDVDAEYAQRLADWEARNRAARAEAVSVTVQGLRQPDGRLWEPNALSSVFAPAAGVAGDMLISQVEFSVDGQGGELTRLELVRPDAFVPEPTAVVKKSKSKGGKASNFWPEIADGGR